MTAVWKRELQNYFCTSVGYVFMGIFLLVGGVVFFLGNILAASASLSTLLGNLNYIFMLIVPILTMKLLSEERRTKTDQLLLTSPLSVWSIVMGKFLAACTVILISTLVTLSCVAVMAHYSEALSPALIATNYLGFLLLGFTYAAIGVLMSALTENQVSAAVLTIGVNLFLQILEGVGASLTIPGLTFLNTVISWLGLYSRYNDFAGGILSFSNIFYYLSVCGVLLFLTVRVIDRRRWSEG